MRKSLWFGWADWHTYDDGPPEQWLILASIVFGLTLAKLVAANRNELLTSWLRLEWANYGRNRVCVAEINQYIFLIPFFGSCL